jgi:hypothetical protein
MGEKIAPTPIEDWMRKRNDPSNLGNDLMSNPTC